MITDDYKGVDGRCYFCDRRECRLECPLWSIGPEEDEAFEDDLDFVTEKRPMVYRDS